MGTVQQGHELVMENKVLDLGTQLVLLKIPFVFLPFPNRI